jgi:hypothetical protein
MRDPALKAQVNHLQRSVTCQLNEWRNDHWSDKLESLDSEDQFLWKMTKMMMGLPIPSPPANSRRNISVEFRETGNPGKQLSGSVSARELPVGSGINSDC